MSNRIVMRTGEALVAGGPPGTAAEPEVVIGELDGPVGTALATLTGDQVDGPHAASSRCSTPTSWSAR